MLLSARSDQDFRCPLTESLDSLKGKAKLVSEIKALDKTCISMQL